MDDIERVRSRFTPERIRILLLGESPPPKRGFFYTGDSTLFYETVAVMTEACGFSGSPVAFLTSFRKAGFFFDDFSQQRGDKPGRRPLDPDVQQAVRRIAGLISAHKPDAVVAVLRTLQLLVQESVTASGFEAPVRVLRFPYWRDEDAKEAYRNGLRAVLGEFGCANR